MVKVLVVAFGGQYNHLIKRSIERIGHEAALRPYNLPPPDEGEFDCVVFGGGPLTMPKDFDKVKGLEAYLRWKKPLLGICLGHQVLALLNGGEVGPSPKPEYGDVTIFVDDEDDILRGLAPSFRAWESHNEEVLREPPNSKVIAHSENTRVQALKYYNGPYYGVQFHPEVQHTEKGSLVFQNFVELCKR
ncbi:GMP synthase subunit A [Ignicoccus hospitalis]|uniref:GMP synthase [glutamine-hydrolyzing] subunit A n=1 Tax=Ignicoccus hospitalis (strain KIN4/I / DSM 18386 / JCM 14125) TaxID=453591 RepID=GUAAA_IGNH4|nr:GMP synthase subunit A [Ignicoccus hospitalis]A8AC69.1 RecName: Full=GMP synthase [glutamine-hydrolyzing] subunit A; AltName: Full=Glutamine amidotransferase [Ignicoccus hospitalis KIN4/I]ABU82521.1 glutamine amidotransferase class-I [Ignicoccus hospitalis KIN4/I]HIH90684.1 GMP synthase subunit A [Desulfurococcaceae archaeon]